ncbi:MAG TPA: type II toxin-antitoxin system antitoxin SocA domain-containing protein [Longimicrobium sp.]|nr:type II toxin-antitoxin system antitoxin SocA domain-containing protein [Longimicrobium sp.]
MAVTSRNVVADYFVRFSHEVGDPITNLKLQKLVYYAQAWHLALQGERLIADPFQAWVHGPVCPPLYQRFRPYGWNPISESVERPALPDAVEAHLREVMEVYGGFSAWELERLTHAEAPWRNARGDLAPDEASTRVISEDDMRSFYAARAAA